MTLLSEWKSWTGEYLTLGPCVSWQHFCLSLILWRVIKNVLVNVLNGKLHELLACMGPLSRLGRHALFRTILVFFKFVSVRVCGEDVKTTMRTLRFFTLHTFFLLLSFLDLVASRQICGEDMVHTTGEVVSVSERQGVATVLLDNGGETYSDRLQEMPLARLKVANTQV